MYVIISKPKGTSKDLVNTAQLIYCILHIVNSEQILTKMELESLTVNLNTAVSVQKDVSFFVHQVFTDIVRQRVGLKDKPALVPVLPSVPLFRQVSLQTTVWH